MQETISESEQILENNLRHSLFSWSKQSGLNPINVERAEGVYFFDRDGKRYLDFSSQLMNMNIGHNDSRVKDAVMKQMEQVNFVFPGAVTKARGDLSKKLADIAPGTLNKTFFTLGGAEAVDNAIKLARVYSGRHKVIATYRSYHGATYGAISTGGDPRKHAVDNQSVPNIVHVDNPYFYRCPWYSKTPEECAERAANHVEQVIKYENPDSVAAIILEGESGSSGCIKYPPGYMKRIREITEKYGILLIDDEVMSGFGRTGKWFAIENHEVVPDIICMAKGLTSGYLPLGGIIVKDEIADHFNDKPLPLGLTYSAHAVSCAAALAVLNIYESDNLFDNAQKMGAYIESQVENMKERHPSIGDFRNTGLLGCIELVKNRETKEPITLWNAKPHQMDVTNKMAGKIRELGMFTFVRWNYIFICPPLIITKEQVDEGLEIISQAIAIADQECN